WFQKALKDKNSKYHDYYIFRDKPNNWTSFFSGSAWNKYDDEYALHLFSKKQMDLNWENEDLRKDVIEMINWWLDKGVDGFRMDVINLISKQHDLNDGDELIGKMMGICGIENYFYGPHLHEYLRQIHDEAFEPHKAFSVGETPGLGMQMAKLVTSENRNELNMIFNFDHLETPGHKRFDKYDYDLNYYRDYMIEWQTKFGPDCWQSLFYNNHDNPRMVSKVTKDKTFHYNLKKLLVVMQMTMKGTPFIFQGDELGLENYEFSNIEEINDVESRNLYVELCKTMDKEKAFEMIKAGSREHARILLPWNKNAKNPLVHQQQADLKILDFYKWIIKTRHENNALIYGNFNVLRHEKDVYSYERCDEKARFIIDCNLSAKSQKAYKISKAYKQINFNEEDTSTMIDTLSPYEVRIYKKI
ncbi:MAG: hypothetical protein K5839_04505, partial [Treponemataceae bacterium]|nr:hypothetical protein [Treponemataceae bacterium]